MIPSATLFGQQGIKLLPQDVSAGDQFGVAVATSGETLIVGANFHDLPFEDAGAAYLYRLNGDQWELQQKLVPETIQEGDTFGISTAIDGNFAVIGALGDDEKGSSAGAAYIYKHQAGSWIEFAKLTAGDGSENDAFGFSVAINGNLVIVGARGADGEEAGAGAAYLFLITESGAVQLNKITANDGRRGDGFGTSVAVNNGHALVGAVIGNGTTERSGVVYVFQNRGVIWEEREKLSASDGAYLDQFGCALSTSGPFVVVGAKSNDGRSIDAGAAYVFQQQDAGFVEMAKLTASDAATADFFGEAVSIDGQTVIVGAPWDDNTAPGSGSAYVYELEGSDWHETMTISSDTGQLNANFGVSVALSGNIAITGATGDGDRGVLAGTAYAFDLEKTATGVEEIARTGRQQPSAQSILTQAFPNPFTQKITLEIQPDHPAALKIEVLDVLGRTVRVLVDASRSAGLHSLQWDGLNEQGAAMPAGVYIIVLTTEDRRDTHLAIKMRHDTSQ